MGKFNTLLNIQEGERIVFTTRNFENSKFDKPNLKFEDEVVYIGEDIHHSAGEILRTIVVGNPWKDGCNIDVGDVTQNNLVNSTKIPPESYYTKVWSPRQRRDRILHGVVDDVIYPNVCEKHENQRVYNDKNEKWVCPFCDS